MKIRHALVSSALVLSLAACGAEEAPLAETTHTPTPSATAATPAAVDPAQTQAFYGDEAPVVVEAPTEEDHGHAHDADGGHIETTDRTPVRTRRGPSRAARLGATALLCAALLGGCKDSLETAAGGLEPLVYIHFTDRTELFVEFRPLIAGEASTFAAHFTRMVDYTPVTQGTVDVVLSGGGAPTERFRVAAPRAPGIFAPVAAPRAPGARNLTVLLEAPGISASHDLGSVVVHASANAARAAPPATPPEGEIGYLKEQQWQTDFAIEAVQPRPVRASITAPATVRASADGEFLLTAPEPGQVRAAERFPVIGQRVQRGQVLATLVPRLGTGTDSASLQAGLVAARSAATLARAEAERVERLFAIQAVAEHRVKETQAALAVAQANLTAAERRSAQLGGASSGGVPLRAPIDGTLAQVHVANGAAVDTGASLFHIVDRSEVWLQVHVSEADAARLAEPQGAAFDLPGLNGPVNIVVGGNGRLVGVGSVIDPVSRSIPVIFALTDPDPRIALNQTVHARVFTGERREALTVPATAVIDDAGQQVVYVMGGGESFSRVPVRTGTRDGERVEVTEGLAPGDRIVAVGAMDVRLAAATPEAMGHGHAH
jgi:RND family efflux transporter MFP subunit